MKVEQLSVAGVVIEEVDLPSLSDADIEAANAYGNLLRAESHPEDPPRPVELTRAYVRNIPSYLVVREFWARDPDGTIAATAEASFTLTDDNKHILQTEVSVRPDRRRRGIAKALLRLVADLAEAENRPLLMGGTSDRVAAGETFARRVGAEPGLMQHINRLLLADVEPERVRAWIEDGPRRAPGYSLVSIDGPYPDDLVDAIVGVHHVMNTAPRENLDMEDWTFTVAQAREWEKLMVASGDERWSLFAREEATGALVGLTETSWNPALPRTVWQMATGVLPEHRGHALGKWLKAVMVLRLMDERPEVEDIRTGNADSNDAMLGINRQLGFKPHMAATSWQVRLESVRSYLGSST